MHAGAIDASPALARCSARMIEASRARYDAVMALMLEVRHLEMVKAISDARSVARAADVLHLSQSALSHALRSLEERLGVRLFERARRMTPTPAGADLAQRAAGILSAVGDAEMRLRLHKSGVSDVVRIATCCYTSYHWLPAACRRLRSSLPSATVRIVGDATPHALGALLNGEIDLAIVHFRPQHRRIAAEQLFTDEQLLITNLDHPLGRRRFVSPDDFRDQHLFAHHAPEQTAFWETFLEPAGVRPVEATSLHTTEAVVDSVKAGLGVAVVARWAVADEIAEGRVLAVRLGASGLRRRWYAAMVRGPQKPATLAMIEALKTDARRTVRRPLREGHDSAAHSVPGLTVKDVKAMKKKTDSKGGCPQPSRSSRPSR
jgi:LysR family transcriptional regulator for metE and metH